VRQARYGHSAFSINGSGQDGTLESGDADGRRDLLRATFTATGVSMAGVTTGIPGYRGKTFNVADIAHVVMQCPRAVKGSWAKVIGIPLHDIAGAITNATADALNTGIDLLAFWRIRHNAREIVIARECPVKAAARPRPLVKKLLHVGDQVLDHRQVG